MHKEYMLEKLKSTERLAGIGKLGRMLHNPLKYLTVIGHRELVYRVLRKAHSVSAMTFFGSRMYITLPASADIYLTQGKAHPSEIRLARFMIHTLTPGGVFIDVGAHFGYFTMLASTIVGGQGQVFAFEASPRNFAVLRKNVEGLQNVAAHENAVADKQGAITFYEFPILYSEYNTSHARQFEDEGWFRATAPQRVVVQGLSLDDFLARTDRTPDFIKIDVEGAEYHVLQGLRHTLQKGNPVVAMEYLSSQRGNSEHQRAITLLRQMSYRSHILDAKGITHRCRDLDEHLRHSGIDSDNIIFQK